MKHVEKSCCIMRLMCRWEKPCITVKIVTPGKQTRKPYCSAEILDETDRQSECKRRRDIKKKKVESKDTQDEPKNNDEHIKQHDKQSTAEWDQMGSSGTAVKKGTSGKNGERKPDGSSGGLTTWCIVTSFVLFYLTRSSITYIFLTIQDNF